MSTTDCKDFLATQFAVNKKAWKRVGKFKDTAGAWVREFAHPEVDRPVFISEADGNLQLVGEPQRLNAKPTAADYVYSLAYDGDERFVLITRGTYWEKNGCMNDQPDYTPGSFLPEDWMADDINEGGTWAIETDLSGDDVIMQLHRAGFHSDPKFDAFVNGQSALTCPAVLAQLQNKALSAAVENVAATAASAAKAKI